MICKGCGESYNEEMFPVCPFCLTAGGIVEAEADLNEYAIEKITCNGEKVNTRDEDFPLDNLKESIRDCENAVGCVNATVNEKKEQDDKIVGVYFENKFNLFVKFCEKNSMVYMSDLDGFDFNSLINVDGIGMGKMYEIVRRYVAYSRGDTTIKETKTEHFCTPIVDVYFEKKFDSFVTYCIKNSMLYMSDLNGFDFNSLINVGGIGKVKLYEIIRRYEAYKRGDKTIKETKMKDFCTIKETKIKNLFTDINEQLLDLDINLLTRLGIRPQTVHLLVKRGYEKIGDVKNMSIIKLQHIVGERNIEKFEAIENDLTKSLIEIFGDFLKDCHEEDDFKLDVKKADGYTLQELGNEEGVTRERVRQRIVKFNKRIEPFMKSIVDYFISLKNYVTEQELLDIYDNDDFGKVIIYWCKNSTELEYLKFAGVFVYANSMDVTTEEKILKIAEEFIGDGLDLYDNLEELETLMQKNGCPYMDEGAFLNLVLGHGYKLYGDFVVKGKQSYGYLCAKIVADYFKTGIKLYDGADLDLLRKYALEIYGDIGIPDNNRALSARLTDYLVLSGRGVATAESNIQVEMFVMGEIKEYIDQISEGEIYYSELFSRFEGKLRMTSNIDNYNFLHGVLKLYYSNEYDFSNRDYLRKIGEGFTSGMISTRIKNYIVSLGKPVHKNDIKKNLPGLTDIVLFNAVVSDNELFQWDYNYYFSVALMGITNVEREYLHKQIEDIMLQNDGYCSDAMLFDEVKMSGREILDKNGIENSNNLYFLCQKIFSDDFDFRRPHIGKKGMIEEMSVKNVALHLLGYPEELSFSKYQTMAERFKWSSVTSGMVFAEIEQDYIRVTDDLYIKKEKFELNMDVIDCVEHTLRTKMDKDFVSLINFEKWDGFPDMGFEWNVYFLRSIIDKFIPNFKIVEIRSKNRRYERGIVLDAQSEIMDYTDLVISFLKKSGYSDVTENNMLTLLIMNSLTYKMIPKELYSSDKIVYENGIFKIA